MSDLDTYLDPVAVECACKLLGAPPFDGPDNVVRQNPNYARACERKYGASATWRRAVQAALSRMGGASPLQPPAHPEIRPAAAFIQTLLWGSSSSE